MAALLYIHGFLSSPQSFKAQQTQAWLAQNHPEIAYYCPQLTPYPEQTRLQLEALVESLLPQPVYLMGSSLGGFWGTWLIEKFNLRGVLINPAVRPHEFMPDYLGRELQNYHTNDTYRLSEEHIQEAINLEIPVARHANYWMLLQTGDKTLDYRDAVAKYAGCKQTVEEGGDHSFQGFERYLESSLEFLKNNS